jgi:hypothetical protein
MNYDLVALSSKWLELKHNEEIAVAERRIIEDMMTEVLKIHQSLDGVETKEIDGLIIKVTGRIDRKVNSEMVQELAAEHGLSGHLPDLFRWTPAINMTAWKRADKEITTPLLDAITSKSGRPSYKITFNT